MSKDVCFLFFFKKKKLDSTVHNQSKKVNIFAVYNLFYVHFYICVCVWDCLFVVYQWLSLM